MSDAKSGCLSPQDAANQTCQVGLEHLKESLPITFLKSFYGGLLLSAGGLLSLIASAGSPGMSPGVQRLLQGALFPIGLVIVYFVGADLYTGYPMWFAITTLERKGNFWLHISRSMASWFGNLAGTLFFAYFFTYLTGSLSEEPLKSGVVDQISSDVVKSDWILIFLKAITCGFLVTIAMFMGSQNQDGISKALGLHLPFFLSVTARFPHTVEYMYMSAIGIMLGAPLSWAGYFWKCLLPITIGNTVGGAILTGAYSWFVFIDYERRAKGEGVGGLTL